MAAVSCHPKIKLNFSFLPDLVLLKIFSYCDLKELGRLAAVCKKFASLLSEDDIWICKSRYVIGSNMLNSTMRSRAKPFLTPKERVKISRKWTRNSYSTINVPYYTLYSHKKCMPCLQLTKDYFYVSRRGHIFRYHRTAEGLCNDDYSYLKTPHNEDVSKFIVEKDRTVSAGSDGTVSYWKNGPEDKPVTFVAHNDYVLGIDVKGDITATCSKDHTIKLFNTKENSASLCATIDVGMRVLAVAFQFEHSLLVCSTPGVNDIHPLQMYDAVTCKIVSCFGRNHMYGAGILCIHPETSYTFITCGYDTTVRLWDIRCPDAHVLQWMDIYDNSIYCVTSDHNVTIVSGASRSGLVHIWDKRAKNAVRMLYGKNSPVYSIGFDPCSLFAACDREVQHYSFLKS